MDSWKEAGGSGKPKEVSCGLGDGERPSVPLASTATSEHHPQSHCFASTLPGYHCNTPHPYPSTPLIHSSIRPLIHSSTHPFYHNIHSRITLTLTSPFPITLHTRPHSRVTLKSPPPTPHSLWATPPPTPLSHLLFFPFVPPPLLPDPAFACAVHFAFSPSLNFLHSAPRIFANSGAGFPGFFADTSARLDAANAKYPPGIAPPPDLISLPRKPFPSAPNLLAGTSPGAILSFQPSPV